MDKIFMDFFSDDFVISKKFDDKKFISDLGDIEKISAMMLLDKISLLNKKDKQTILSNDLVRTKLRGGLLSESRDNQWYYYREILSKISVSNFLSLYDVDFLNKYFTIHGGEYLYKFWACLSEVNINTVLKLIMNDDSMLESFLSASNNFEALFENLNYDLLKNLIYKLQNLGSDFHYDFLSCIKKEYQYLLLQDDKINDNTLICLINSFYYEVKSYFFENDKRALYMYDKFDIPMLVKAGVKFNNNILKKEEFFNLLKDRSLVMFRNNINNVEKYNNPEYIEQRLEKYYDELLSLYSSFDDMFIPYKEILNNPGSFTLISKNSSYLFNQDIIDRMNSSLRIDSSGKYYFDNMDDLKLFLKKETSKKLSEIMIDALFRDNIYNVWLNIKEMIRYNSKLESNEKVLSNDKINFYDLVANFDKLNNEDKYKFYYAFKDKNINLMFYEDLRMIKDFAYNKIKKSLFNVGDSLDSDCSYLDGVKVFDNRLASFNMLVRTQSQYKDTTYYRRNCYSIISNENTCVFGSNEYNSFLYGYNSFDNDTILHMFERDSYSSSFKEQSSRFVNRIMTVDELVRSYVGYSEIQIVNNKKVDENYKYSVKRPDFIVVFDRILGEHIDEAKRLGIPIVIISKKKLDDNMKIDTVFNENNDIYVDSIYRENERRISR